MLFHKNLNSCIVPCLKVVVGYKNKDKVYFFSLVTPLTSLYGGSENVENIKKLEFQNYGRKVIYSLKRSARRVEEEYIFVWFAPRARQRWFGLSPDHPSSQDLPLRIKNVSGNTITTISVHYSSKFWNSAVFLILAVCGIFAFF